MNVQSIGKKIETIQEGDNDETPLAISDKQRQKLNEIFNEIRAEWGNLNEARADKLDADESAFADINEDFSLRPHSSEKLNDLNHQYWEQYFQLDLYGFDVSRPDEKTPSTLGIHFLPDDVFEYKDYLCVDFGELGLIRLSLNRYDNLMDTPFYILQKDGEFTLRKNDLSDVDDLLSSARDIDDDDLYNHKSHVKEYVENGYSNELVQSHFEDMLPSFMDKKYILRLIPLIMGETEETVVKFGVEHSSAFEHFCSSNDLYFYNISMSENEMMDFEERKIVRKTPLSTALPNEEAKLYKYLTGHPYFDGRGHNASTFETEAKWRTLTETWRRDEHVCLFDTLVESPVVPEDTYIKNQQAQIERLIESIYEFDEKYNFNVGSELIDTVIEEKTESFRTTLDEYRHMKLV